MSQHILVKWGLLAANPSASVRLRVFDKNGAMAGAFNVTVPQVSTLLPSCGWASGWSDDYVGAEVISVTNGPVYALPVSDVSELTAQTGKALVANFDLGRVPLDDRANPKPSFTEEA